MHNENVIMLTMRPQEFGLREQNISGEGVLCRGNTEARDCDIEHQWRETIDYIIQLS